MYPSNSKDAYYEELTNHKKALQYKYFKAPLIYADGFVDSNPDPKQNYYYILMENLQVGEMTLASDYLHTLETDVDRTRQEHLTARHKSIKERLTPLADKARKAYEQAPASPDKKEYQVDRGLATPPVMKQQIVSPSPPSSRTKITPEKVKEYDTKINAFKAEFIRIFIQMIENKTYHGDLKLDNIFWDGTTMRFFDFEYCEWGTGKSDDENVEMLVKFLEYCAGGIGDEIYRYFGEDTSTTPLLKTMEEKVVEKIMELNKNDEESINQVHSIISIHTNETRQGNVFYD